MELPALFSSDQGTARRVFEFFAANIRNRNTRKAYDARRRGQARLFHERTAELGHAPPPAYPP